MYLIVLSSGHPALAAESMAAAVTLAQALGREGWGMDGGTDGGGDGWRPRCTPQAAQCRSACPHACARVVLQTAASQMNTTC